MKKLLLLLTMLLIGIGSTWAETYDFVTAQTKVTEVASITSGKYYVIDGLNQVNSNSHFLFDNGTKVTSNNPQTLPTDPAEVGKFIWKIEGNSTDGWTLQNLATGNYMSLGSSNGSAISSSATPQTNGIYFGVVDEVTYATILNSNGQAIDMGGWGDAPTTWSGSTTPGGSRRLTIYEVDVVEIEDDACYTLDFVSFDETKTWGLKAGTTEQAPVANGTGDVFVAHSYTNADGNKRWIFVNNSNGTYLAYHGQANTAFDISNAINEWNIDILTSGTYVDASANLAGKLSITNDKRYTNNSSQGCYLVKETNGAYDNASAPIYKLHNGNYFTPAIRFTATGDAVSSAATLAIAKFEALYEVKNYLPSAGNITALFADPSSIESNINAAATAEAAATIATNFMKSPEGKKFYIQNAAKSRYLTVGSSVLSATSTTLTADDVMEVEYAGNSKYYLKGIFRGTYVCTPNMSSDISTTATKGSAETFYIINRDNDTDNEVYFSNKASASGNYGAIHYSSGYTYAVVGWTYNSDNSQWHITAVSDAKYTELCNATCDVTYNAVIAASGTVLATATTFNATRGAALAMPSAIARNYCTMTFYSDAACTSEITTVPDAATATVYVLVTDYKPPFTLSASYETATWYYATLRGTKFIRADESAKDDSGRYTTNTTNEKTDVYKWAFVGTNPYDLTIMNRGAGNSKYLYAGTQPVMQTATPASDNKARWIAVPNSQGAFAIRSESGATLYINDAGSSDNLGYWNSSWATGDAGSNWVITEVPTVDVTYNFVVDDETVNTIVVYDVPEYSEVAVPSGLKNGYTTFAYDFENSGTIGGENSTITVTGTLKDGLVKVGDLSNSKKYKLTCVRGSLSTYDDNGTVYLASPTKTSLEIEGKEFAIINHSDKKYLYSVSDEKFVTYSDNQHAPLTTKPATTDAISFSETSKSVYKIMFDNSTSKIINSSASYTYGIVINDWGSYTSHYDDGNQYVIEEIDDFDPTSATGTLTYNNIIANLKAIRWGLTSESNRGKLNYYNFTGNTYGGFAGLESTLIAEKEDEGYSAENLQAVKGMSSNYALNMPTTGKFYRIKGYSNNYITSNTAGSNASMNGTASANNIVYYSEDSQLIFFGSGYGLYNTSIVAPAGSTLNTYTFSEGAQSSHYYIRSNATGMGTYCYDNTSNGTKVDRSTNPVTSGSYQTDWTLEEVTSLPVTHANSYTSFSAPVAVTIPDGCDAYIATDKDGSAIKLTKVEGSNIAANTGLIIGTEDGSSAINFSFPIYTGDELASTDGNILSGDIVVATPLARDDHYFFGKQTSTGNYIFTKLSGKGDNYTLPGFKAYLKAEDIPSASGEARIAIIWGDDDPTGISELNDESITLGDGKYYQNGKVVVVRNGVKYNVAGQIMK